jgi:hypothetical protein
MAVSLSVIRMTTFPRLHQLQPDVRAVLQVDGDLRCTLNGTTADQFENLIHSYFAESVSWY